MEKRVFLAILLSFAVLALYQAYLAPPPPVIPSADQAPAAPPSPVTSAPAVPPAGAAAPAPDPAQEAAADTPGVQPLVADTEARRIVVETDAVRAVFSNQGATLESWRLKHYFDHDGQPLELVPTDLPPGSPRPFTLSTNDELLSRRLASALFQTNQTTLALGSEPGVLRFQYSDSSGLSATKTFHFQPDGKPYVLSVEASVDVNGASRPVTLEWGPALSLGYSDNGSSEIPARAILFRGGDVERIHADALREEPRYSGQMRVAGVEEHYFMAVALPGEQSVEMEFQPLTLPVPGAAEDLTRSFVAFDVTVPAGAPTLPFYIGPKDFEVLRAVDPQLTRAIDFGIFAWLVVPLLQALKWVHGFVGNYGWSIVILTVIINLLLFPLRHRSMVSMKKMQALQPEIKAIQKRYEKYKITDPERQKMNSEMMALYKQKKVNPASGCLPMLLMMPVLFAFYSMLQVAIEVRGAPFFGWVTDLSARDPFFIWPVLMGATMFWQQKLTPTTMDPSQARVFMIMPFVFTVMFLWFPAGLVIYWLTSNVMAIGQQYITNNLIAAKPAVAKTPAADAASKASKRSKR